MTNSEITESLQSLFGDRVQIMASDSWQIEVDGSRLLVLLSEDQTWLRVMIPIASAQEAMGFAEQLLEANFDETQETRYAFHQEVLWGVFQHSCESLTNKDFKAAIDRLLFIQQKGLSESFHKVAESQIRQIVKAAKLHGQTLAATLQTLERFYEEGVMGSISQSSDERKAVMSAWRYQLERLWDEA